MRNRIPSKARLENFWIWTLKKQLIKEIICQANKIMEKLNRAQKCSMLGPQNLGSRGEGRAHGPPPGSAPGQVRLKLIYIERDISVHVNNDIFVSISSAQPQELVTCQSWRFIIYIALYCIRVCDFHTCRRYIAKKERAFSLWNNMNENHSPLSFSVNAHLMTRKVDTFLGDIN